MQSAPLHHDEDRRLTALRRYEILDTAPEQDFDHLTDLAATLCGRPIALVSLVDADRQWFKSRFGLDATETPRDVAFCAHAIVDDEPIFEVEDARVDQRFHDNPLVTGGPRVIAYAGATLRSHDGLPLGTLCVIDQTPAQLTESQRAGLTRLARLAEKLLEQRLLLDELAASTRRAGELQEILRSYTGHSAWETVSSMDSTTTAVVVEDEREQAYVFADVAGFTKLSTRLTSRQVVDLLNARLGLAAALTYEHGGDVEKFIGDAVFAVFPHADAAIEFALTLQAEAAGLNTVCGESLQFSVGVHCGESIRVHLGSDERRDNTLIGEAINVAARLQSACPPGGVLISEATLALAQMERVGQVGEYRLKGFNEPILAHLFGAGTTGSGSIAGAARE